jgi:hypothetical protein
MSNVTEEVRSVLGLQCVPCATVASAAAVPTGDDEAHLLHHGLIAVNQRFSA